MQLSNNGFDDHSTYYELNIDRTGIPTIFIHGVGLNNTMWLPQKKYFQNNKVVFYPIKKEIDTIDGMWVSGLPNKVRIVITGQEYITVGQVVEIQ